MARCGRTDFLKLSFISGGQSSYGERRKRSVNWYFRYLWIRDFPGNPQYLKNVLTSDI